jgi:hypothetical protein
MLMHINQRLMIIVAVEQHYCLISRPPRADEQIIGMHHIKKHNCSTISFIIDNNGETIRRVDY